MAEVGRAWFTPDRRIDQADSSITDTDADAFLQNMARRLRLQSQVGDGDGSDDVRDRWVEDWRLGLGEELTCGRRHDRRRTHDRRRLYGEMVGDNGVVFC